MFGFSQSEVKHHYTQGEVSKLTIYIMDLEKKMDILPPELYSDNKKHVATLLSDSSNNYLDEDIIKIFGYIKDLEKQVSFNNLLASAKANSKKDTSISTTSFMSKPIAYLLVKGIVVFADSSSQENYSNVVITVSEKENSQLVGIYTPNSKTGKYIFILNSGTKYEIEAEIKGYKTYLADFFPEKKNESYEMGQEIKLKKE